MNDIIRGCCHGRGLRHAAPAPNRPCKQLDWPALLTRLMLGLAAGFAQAGRRGHNSNRAYQCLLPEGGYQRASLTLVRRQHQTQAMDARIGMAISDGRRQRLSAIEQTEPSDQPLP